MISQTSTVASTVTYLCNRLSIDWLFSCFSQPSSKSIRTLLLGQKMTRVIEGITFNVIKSPFGFLVFATLLTRIFDYTITYWPWSISGSCRQQTNNPLCMDTAFLHFIKFFWQSFLAASIIRLKTEGYCRWSGSAVSVWDGCTHFKAVWYV